MRKTAFDYNELITIAFQHNYVYMDIKIAGQLVGSLLIEASK